MALQIGLVAGTTLGAALLLTIPFVGWLEALGLAYAGLETLLNTKFEDSGLMLFVACRLQLRVCRNRWVAF